VAHLNHYPPDCRDANLVALCQRCHLTYDAKIHARNRAETLRRQMQTGDLFMSDKPVPEPEDDPLDDPVEEKPPVQAPGEPPNVVSAP
jgi:hypothetical protein